MEHAMQSAQETGQADNPPSLPAQRTPLAPFLAGFFLALALFALGLFTAVRSGAISGFAFFQSEDERPIAIPSGDAVAARAAIPAILAALGEAKALIETAPQTLPASEAGKFMPFANVFPDIYKALPPASRSGMIYLVRRDGDAYKILVGNRICPVVAALHPEMRDPLREQDLEMLCYYFGLWNEAGEKF